MRISLGHGEKGWNGKDGIQAGVEEKGMDIPALFFVKQHLVDGGVDALDNRYVAQIIRVMNGSIFTPKEEGWTGRDGEVTTTTGIPYESEL